MITLTFGLRVYLVYGVTDMRMGIMGSAMLVQQGLSAEPFDGAVFVFRGLRAGLTKNAFRNLAVTRMVAGRPYHGRSRSTRGQ